MKKPLRGRAIGYSYSGSAVGTTDLGLRASRPGGTAFRRMRIIKAGSHAPQRGLQTRAAIAVGQQAAHHSHAARGDHRRCIGDHGGHADQRRQAVCHVEDQHLWRVRDHHQQDAGDLHHHRRIYRVSEAQRHHLRRLPGGSFRLQVLRIGRRAAHSATARSCMERNPPPTRRFAAGRGPCPRSRTSNIAVGRSFTEMEDTHSAHVAIVGSDIVDNVLGPGDPLGKEIRVDGVPYTVIGVGERQGKMFGQSMDNWVAIPLTTFLETYGSKPACKSMWMRAAGGAVMESVRTNCAPSCARGGTWRRMCRTLSPSIRARRFQNMLGQYSRTTLAQWWWPSPPSRW